MNALPMNNEFVSREEFDALKASMQNMQSELTDLQGELTTRMLESDQDAAESLAEAKAEEWVTLDDNDMARIMAAREES